MDLLLSVVVGVLFASGCYLLMQRTLGHVIIGLAMLTNATNLLIFVAGGLTRDRAALIPEGGLPEGATTVDPLPQALILTAIVIGLGVLAFFIALAYRAYRSVGSDDLAHMNTTDRVDTTYSGGNQSERGS
jgi:multicomponent Na+:H+ antiporter subunit C